MSSATHALTAPAISTATDASPHWREYSDAAAPGEWVSRVRVGGMHCAACAPTVQAVLAAVPGVVDVQLDAATARARVTWREDQVSPQRWAAALADAGYSALPVRGAGATALARRAQRQMLWRWLVAGFCMMQVMMYQWPQYTAAPGELGADADRLLRWASWVLTLPVLLFSSGPFFQSALRDAKLGRVGMDTPVALGIAIAFAVSTVAAFDPTGPWGGELYFDSLTMFVFILLSGRWLEARLKLRTAGALDAIAEQLPLAAQRVGADGTLSAVGVAHIQPGDRLRVRAGESFAVDGVVQSGVSWADESLLTGESRPVLKQVGDAVAAGSINLSQPLDVRAQRLGADTRFAHIVALMEQSARNKPRVVALADQVAQPFLLGVLLIAAAAAAWWWPTDPQRAVLAAIAVLIVTCPCALALAAPAAMLSAAAALARKGVLVRELSALERASGIRMVAFDKTGTLTQGSMVVSRAEISPPWTRDAALGVAGAMAAHSLHPASQAVRAAQPLAATVYQIEEVHEHAGLGLAAKVRGLDGEMRLGSAAFCNGASADTDQPTVTLSSPQGVVAVFTLQEQLQTDAAQAMQALTRMGIRVAVLSGDAARSVRRIAGRLGMPMAPSLVRSSCSAEDKLAAVQDWQSHGQCVAMVGDGINDAPVLARADASFAFTHGAALAQVKADFLLLGSQLKCVPQTLAHAAKTMRIVKQNLAWAIVYNLVCIPLALSGWLTPWLAGLGMALSSLLVLANAARLSDLKD